MRAMSTERLIPRFVKKPWGVERLPEWLLPVSGGERIGEVWFDKRWPDGGSAELLVKYLLTSERLSIQVHPGDSAAARGKSEAWYVLDAGKNAEIGFGLKRRASPEEIEAAARDGSLVDLIDWRKVRPGEVIYVEPGTVHAIGPDCLLIEVQQNVDVTYRLFDYGRPRELHLRESLAVARLEPAPQHFPARRIDDIRQVLVESPRFVMERWDIPAKTEFVLGGAGELWLTMLKGSLEIQGARFLAGEVAFHFGDDASALTGEDGASLIVAYPGSAVAERLLFDLKAATHGFWDANSNPGIDPGQPTAL
jgi:mannose-6-phosphate isomerase